MRRQAQGFSLSLIVIAAIALVVMVIIIALSTASGSNIFQNTQSCESLGSTNSACLPACESGWAEQRGRTCEAEGTICCQRIS